MNDDIITDPELEKRMLAAGMIWDDKADDWIPDPAIWYGDGEEWY